MEKNNLISSFEIKKIYPNTIQVKIKKTEFLGITNIDGNSFFIGSNGKFIDYENTKKNLPYVFGKVDPYVFIEFVKIIKKSKFDLNTVKEFYFFPSERWDIKTKDNKLFKLPSENLELNCFCDSCWLGFALLRATLNTSSNLLSLAPWVLYSRV